VGQVADRAVELGILSPAASAGPADQFGYVFADPAALSTLMTELGIAPT
jgi:hypothetical protein